MHEENLNTPEDSGSQAEKAPQTNQPEARKKRSRYVRRYPRRRAKSQTAVPLEEKDSGPAVTAESEAGDQDKATKDKATKEDTSQDNMPDIISGLKIHPAGEGIRELKFPGLDAAQARKNLVQYVRDQREHSGCKNAVLRLDGGLDSSVVAGLLTEAMGSKHVHLVYFIQSDRHSMEHARAVLAARCLGCYLEIRDIRPPVDKVLAGHGAVSETRKMQFAARAGMATLYDIAETKEARVVGGLNKTKWLLGYGITHGDLAYDFNLLGGLYRSQVLELAKALHVPKEILEKAKQTHLADVLPKEKPADLDWEEVDYYLYQMVDVRLALSYVYTLGADKEKLSWIYRRLRDTADKRQLPHAPEMVSVYMPGRWKK
ncbi:NAD(+) synthase [bacterium]|nr:NAD(+) synthase [bacterium]